MVSSTVTAFVVIYTLEAFVIIVGNTFTIFVFWTQRSRFKRTFSILINLAVSDLLVGIAEPIVLGREKIAKMTASPGKEKSSTNPSSAFQVLASSTSVLFLALISLERVYSVLWPVQHRATSTRTYIFTITAVWGLGLCFFGLSVLSLYHTKLEMRYVTLTIHASLFMALLVICGSYLQIRKKLRANVIPGEEIHVRQTAERNLRLSRTVFIVIAVSLVFWLPATIVYATQDFCRPPCLRPIIVSLVNALHLAHSMVNPIVYSFRMAIFKDALKKLSRRCRLHSVCIEPVQVTDRDLGGSFSPKTQHPRFNSPELEPKDDISTYVWNIRNKTIKQYSVTVSKQGGELSTCIIGTVQMRAWFSQQLHSSTCFPY